MNRVSFKISYVLYFIIGDRKHKPFFGLQHTVHSRANPKHLERPENLPGRDNREVSKAHPHGSKEQSVTAKRRRINSAYNRFQKAKRDFNIGDAKQTVNREY